MMPRSGICLPRTCTAVGDGAFKVFGSDGTPPIIPESDWPQYAKTLEGHVWHVIDQGGQNSCCGAAGAGAVILGRELAGANRVVISQASLYGVGNGGRDNGMAIDVCLNVLTETGANPVGVIDQYDWQGYWRRAGRRIRRETRAGAWPDGWQESAKRYRCLEAWDCPDYKAAVSAVLSGFPVVYGTHGHAVVMIGWIPERGHIDLNSWGADWGNNGCGQWASRREVERQLPGYGAWALRVMTDPTDDGDVPMGA